MDSKTFTAHVSSLVDMAGDGDWGRRYARQGSRPTRALRILLADWQNHTCPRCGTALDMDVTNNMDPEFVDLCHIVGARPLGSTDDRRGYVEGNLYAGHHGCNVDAVAGMAEGTLPVETFKMFARPDVIVTDWQGYTMGSIAVAVRKGVL